MCEVSYRSYVHCVCDDRGTNKSICTTKRNIEEKISGRLIKLEMVLKLNVGFALRDFHPVSLNVADICCVFDKSFPIACMESRVNQVALAGCKI